MCQQTDFLLTIMMMEMLVYVGVGDYNDDHENEEVDHSCLKTMVINQIQISMLAQKRQTGKIANAVQCHN